MLGQGDYAYAVLFYGKRRPILIDLIFSPEEELLEHQYTAVMRGGPAIMGETCVPSPKGKKVTLWGIATPLFDESGEITGAIESIRDISDRKKQKRRSSR